MQHLACIMDGNRRFAKRHGWKPWIGHNKGVEAVRATVDFCIRKNIRYLSLYTFSIENFKRSQEEKHYLFELLIEQIKININEFIEKQIRIRFIGDRAAFPSQVLHACEQVELATINGTCLQVNLLFCYGGRQEIVDTAKRIALLVQQGEILPSDIDTSLFTQHLWLGDIPAPDLIFRTGGVHRLSNFLLFQSAYSEFYFSDLLWPEVTAEHLQQAVDAFTTMKRNFGS